jgi:branched-chain amino acid transport system substrate-binding protein
MRNFLDAAGPAGEGVFTTNSFIPASQNMRHKMFVTNYLKRFGEASLESAMSAAQGYDAMRLLYNGLATAKDLDGDSIREALENLGGRGVEGVVTTYMRPFTPEDHDAITENMLVVGIVRNGRIDYAFEEDARQSHGIRHKRP